MSEQLIIKLAAGKELVAEVYKADVSYPEELTVYVRDKDGIILQDVCLVRPHCEFDCNGLHIDSEEIDCLVWGDEDNEDYTHKFVIQQYKEEN